MNYQLLFNNDQDFATFASEKIITILLFEV